MFNLLLTKENDNCYNDYAIEKEDDIMLKDTMLEEIENYAHSERIPIMLKDGIEYLCNYIKEHNIKRILEIGSAIGYSAIKMALVSDDITVTTIEKDKVRYDMAVLNIQKFNLDKRIKIILGDALETEIDGEYDLIFIDASKGNNTNFFKKYSKNLSSYGIIITDNLLFHGLVRDEKLIKTKNQRGIVRKIKDYIDFLDKNEEFETMYLDIGDGIAISRRK